MAKDKRTSVYFDREKLEFVGLDDVVKKQLIETYQGIDLDRELNKMKIWLGSSKGKDRKGTIGFIMNWLQNATPSIPHVSIDLDLMESDSPLGLLLQDYRKDLWKNRENILEFNTIRR